MLTLQDLLNQSPSPNNAYAAIHYLLHNILASLYGHVFLTLFFLCDLCFLEADLDTFLLYTGVPGILLADSNCEMKNGESTIL